VGGIKGTLKALQIGGTAGPVFGPEALTYQLDFPSMKKVGGALGSGAIVAMNTSVNMVDVLAVTMRFFAQESCGQCFPCRYGTRQLDFMAHQIAIGAGKEHYLDRMRETAQVMVGASFCPFGQSIAMPLYSLLDGFGEEILTFMKQGEYFREEEYHKEAGHLSATYGTLVGAPYLNEAPYADEAAYLKEAGV